MLRVSVFLGLLLSRRLRRAGLRGKRELGPLLSALLALLDKFPRLALLLFFCLLFLLLPRLFQVKVLLHLHFHLSLRLVVSERVYVLQLNFGLHELLLRLLRQFLVHFLSANLLFWVQLGMFPVLLEVDCVQVKIVR